MRVRPDGHRSPRPAVALLVGAVALGPVLAGCGGGNDKADDAAGSPTASGTPTASGSGSVSGSPTGSPASSPTPRPPKEPRAGKDTAAARKAFASFVIARWGYALRTNDAGAVTGLSPKKQACEGCKDFAAELTKRRKQHWYVDFPGAKVRSVTVTPAGPHTSVARAKVDIPASTSLFKDGSFRNQNAAHRGATFFVRMAYAGKGYELLAFQ